MKIASSFKWIGLLQIVAMVATSAILLQTASRETQEISNASEARTLNEAVASLRYLTFEYVLLHNERTRSQWRLLHTSMGKLLKESRGDPTAIESLRTAHEQVGEMFDQIQPVSPALSDIPGNPERLERESRIVGRVVGLSESMIANARSLSASSRARVAAARERANYVVGSSIALIALLMLAKWLLLQRKVLRPLATLRSGAAKVGSGDLQFRLDLRTSDEMGEVAGAFDEMTAELAASTVSRARLEQANADLLAEETVRLQAEQKIRSQLAALMLLHQITRAIGERQDLRSIFQVVVRSLEDWLPADFACVCRYDKTNQTLIVDSVGVRSYELALELAMTDQSVVPVDGNGLSRCVAGQLVYESDVSLLDFPFPQRLIRAGLGSFVAAPLMVEGQVFGALVVARRQAAAFSSDECEVLQQLTEHMGLASHQVQMLVALQEAYGDLRHTQQSIAEHERLRALGQMASGVAHDINNAISPVALYVERMLECEPGLSEQGRKQLVIIQQSIEDVAHTVASMREFYRRRDPQSEPGPVDLNALLPQVTELTRARWHDMAQRRGTVVKVVSELGANLPQVNGVQSELRDAMINLVLNAVDAMPNGGILTLRTLTAHGGAAGSQPPQAVLEVRDTGIGMEEATRRRCLEPFFSTKGERGTGLGLAMVYGAAQRHGAAIEITSVLGKGTAVRVVFPACVAAAPPLEAEFVLPRLGLRLLLVDDDPVLLKSLSEALAADGHVISSADGGQSGIDAFNRELAQGTAFDGVITDLGMPRVSGREVAAAIKQASPGTPVFLLTGWGRQMEDDLERPLQVDCVLSKPPRMKELRQALAYHCGDPAEAAAGATDRDSVH
jgi:signal transduction histidine kinase/ActR/RegA family two-component response regulator/HAMP domain-containing protein